METIYEGTWEELQSHSAELTGRRVRVIVQDIETAGRLMRFEQGLARIKEIGRGIGPFPYRDITLDLRYPDDEERA